MKKLPKDLMKQVIMLMVVAAILAAAVFHSQTVFRAIVRIIDILVPFFAGGAIAYVLNLPMRTIENKVCGKWTGKAAGMKRPFALVVTLVAVIALFSVVTAIIVPNIVTTWNLLTKQMPGYLKAMSDFAEGIKLPGMGRNDNVLVYLSENWEIIQENVTAFIYKGVPGMLGSTVEVVGNVAGVFVNGIIAIVFAILILLDKERLARQCDTLLDRYIRIDAKPRTNARVREIVGIMDQKFSGFITGQCMDAVVLGLMFMIVLSVMRMPYSIAIGAVICITGVIPIVGAMIGLIFGIFTIFMVNPAQALIFVVVFFIVQQIESNMIYPKIVGDKVGLPAMWVIFAITIGGSLMGIVGMLVFIPIVSTCYQLLK